MIIDTGPAPSEGAKKVAIIDDEPMLLDLYSRALKKDYHVFTAANGNEGLELVKKEKPDLALIDILMPGMDGFELIKKLEEDGFGSMPMVVLTNSVTDEKLAKAIEGRVADYLLKTDYTPKDILEKVKSLIG